MQPWEIVLICFCAIIAVALGMWWKHSLLTQLTKANEDKKTKGEKMRENKKATLDALEGQQQMIDELKDKIEYLELKENGAEITWGQYTLVRYAYDGEIKEITIGGQMECYKLERETEQYIILREISRIITDYSTGKWEQVTTFHIIDKSTRNIYNTQTLNEELERYNEMQKMLNEIEEENKEKGE